MKISYLLLSCALTSSCVQTDTTAPVAQTNAFALSLIEELRCERRPDPGPLLQNMIIAGALESFGGSNVDSVTCKLAAVDLAVAGLPITAVCGYEDDPSEWEKYDNLFSRGPGTSPPQLTAVQTTLSVEQATAWYTQTIGTPTQGVQISAPYFFIDGVTEISCRDSNF